MRKITTIVAFAAAIMMAGAVAQAQNWTAGALSGATGDHGRITGATNFQNPATTNIGNLYWGGGATGNFLTAGTYNIASLHVDAARFGYSFTNSSRASITNFWLQAGQATLNGVNFGSNVTGTVRLADNGIWLNGEQSAMRTKDNNNYGVRVVSGGTLNILEFNGGTVQNAGTITDMILGSGVDVAKYTGAGSIGTLSFAEGSDEFTIGSIARVGAYDLTNADLRYNLTSPVEIGLIAWDAIFGTTNVTGWDMFANFDFYYENSKVDFADLGYLVAFGDDGVNVTAIPEPATLAVLGLGLAGLGLARRRGRK